MADASPSGPISAAGTVFLEHLEVYKEMLGEEAVARALEAVPAEVRQAYESCVPGAWIDVDVSAVLYAELARVAGRDPVKLHAEVVRTGYARALKGLWKALILRLTTDRALVSRAPMLYAKTFDAGEMTGTLKGPGQAVFEVVGWPGIPVLHQVGISSGMQAVLELSGRASAKIDRAETPDGVRFDVRWA